MRQWSIYTICVLFLFSWGETWGCLFSMVLSNCWKELSSCLHDEVILLENTRHKLFLNHWIKNGSILRMIHLMTGFTKETQKEITSFLKKTWTQYNRYIHFLFPGSLLFLYQLFQTPPAEPSIHQQGIGRMKSAAHESMCPSSGPCTICSRPKIIQNKTS